MNGRVETTDTGGTGTVRSMRCRGRTARRVLAGLSIAVLVATAPLQGQDVDYGTPGEGISVSVEGVITNVIPVARVKMDRPGYLALFEVEPGIGATMLYPYGGGEEQLRLSAGEHTVRLNGPRAAFARDLMLRHLFMDFVHRSPVQPYNYLVAVTSDRPLREEDLLSDRIFPYPEGDADVGEVTRALVSSVAPTVPEARLATATVNYSKFRNPELLFTAARGVRLDAPFLVVPGFGAFQPGVFADGSALILGPAGGGPSVLGSPRFFGFGFLRPSFACRTVALSNHDSFHDFGCVIPNAQGTPTELGGLHAETTKQAAEGARQRNERTSGHTAERVAHRTGTGSGPAERVAGLPRAPSFSSDAENGRGIRPTTSAGLEVERRTLAGVHIPGARLTRDGRVRGLDPMGRRTAGRELDGRTSRAFSALSPGRFDAASGGRGTGLRGPERRGRAETSVRALGGRRVSLPGRNTVRGVERGRRTVALGDRSGLGRSGRIAPSPGRSSVGRGRGGTGRSVGGRTLPGRRGVSRAPTRRPSVGRRPSSSAGRGGVSRAPTRRPSAGRPSSSAGRGGVSRAPTRRPSAGRPSSSGRGGASRSAPAKSSGGGR